MAIFQCHIQVISRGEGRSVVSAAAYRSASRIENNYTGLTDDYTQQGWVEYSEIILPANAPGEWNDRAILWNAVEEAEKSRDCRLAREIEVALPQELSLQENIRLVQEFVRDSFVSDGMIADINIHNPPVRDSSGIPVDADGNRVTDRKAMVFRNPHAHILLTLRPLDENGRWMPKTEKEYLCKKGNQTKAFTAEEFKAAKEEGALNVIALPHDWSNYGEVIESFKMKYPEIKVTELNPNASSKEELDAAKTNKGTDAAPDVFDVGQAIAATSTVSLAPD